MNSGPEIERTSEEELPIVIEDIDYETTKQGAIRTESKSLNTEQIEPESGSDFPQESIQFSSVQDEIEGDTLDHSPEAIYSTAKESERHAGHALGWSIGALVTLILFWPVSFVAFGMATYKVVKSSRLRYTTPTAQNRVRISIGFLVAYLALFLLATALVLILIFW